MPDVDRFLFSSPLAHAVASSEASQCHPFVYPYLAELRRGHHTIIESIGDDGECQVVIGKKIGFSRMSLTALGLVSTLT